MSAPSPQATAQFPQLATRMTDRARIIVAAEVHATRESSARLGRSIALLMAREAQIARWRR